MVAKANMMRWWAYDNRTCSLCKTLSRCWKGGGKLWLELRQKFGCLGDLEIIKNQIDGGGRRFLIVLTSSSNRCSSVILLTTTLEMFEETLPGIG